MNFRLLVLFLCGALVIPTVQAMDEYEEGGTDDGLEYTCNQSRGGCLFREYSNLEKIQIGTSLARFPLAVTANFLKTKNRKLGYLVSALANALRFIDNELSIAHGENKYNIFLTSYDIIRFCSDLVIAFNSTQSDMELSTPAVNSTMTKARKILLPLVEAGAAFYAASSNNDGENLTRIKAQSVCTFAQLLSDYLDSEAHSTESKLLLACLIINGISAGYDFTLAKNETSDETSDETAGEELARLQHEVTQRRNRNQRLEEELQPLNQPERQTQHRVNARLTGEDENSRVTIEHITEHRIRENAFYSEGSSRQSADSNVQCPACNINYQVDDQLAVLPCQHTYHRDCLNNEFDAQLPCGVCNEVIGDEALDIVTLN